MERREHGSGYEKADHRFRPLREARAQLGCLCAKVRTGRYQVDARAVAEAIFTDLGRRARPD